MPPEPPALETAAAMERLVANLKVAAAKRNVVQAIDVIRIRVRSQYVVNRIKTSGP